MPVSAATGPYVPMNDSTLAEIDVDEIDSADLKRFQRRFGAGLGQRRHHDDGHRPQRAKSR